MEKDLQNNTNVNENALNIDVSSSEDQNEDFLIDALEQKPQRIRVIGPRHPTLISSKINSISSSNKEDWNTAIQKELMNMERLNVWTLRKKKDHPITSTLVFKEKQDDTGNTVEYQACLCAHTFHQISGVDYQSTFAPAGGLLSLCNLMSFATIHKYEFHQMDVQSAFLNAPLQEKICLEIPQGVLANKETQVLQLNKALYGLKQASLVWYKHITKWLITLCFQCSITDPCIFWRKGKSSIWLYVHVDYLAIFIEDFKQEIKKDFDMKELVKARLLLGIKINHLSDGFSLNKEHYINELANRYKIYKVWI
ncbi:hypothetical protein O181_037333 [Austropuccinia psidii MF-1]|uniref:Reverse transcriptase Ty1/copia-type domain-containing protein n=1 Tax=Austropuccinia psidii MF-1 TaxID=1389203 RepID=A0A9Q3HA01_9BASI|nr:hypothetical protein [Austropuccinia psidii MF-1]